MFIDWNLPQPFWAREFQDKVVTTIRLLGGKQGG